MSGIINKVKGALGGSTSEEPVAHSGTHGTHHTAAAPGAGYGSATGHHGTDQVERATERAAAEEAAATGRPAVAQTVTTAAAAPAAGGQEAVCGQEFFTKTEDRPVVTERVEYIKEHRPVEKEFVVETRATGVERELMEGRTVEHLGTTERIVSVAQPKAPCE